MAAFVVLVLALLVVIHQRGTCYHRFSSAPANRNR
jgi:hypothetical protein